MADNETVMVRALWTRIRIGVLLKLSAVNSFYLCKTSHHFPITKAGLVDCRLAARVWRDDYTKSEAEYCEHCKAGYIVTFSKRRNLDAHNHVTTSSQG